MLNHSLALPSTESTLWHFHQCMLEQGESAPVMRKNSNVLLYVVVLYARAHGNMEGLSPPHLSKWGGSSPPCPPYFSAPDSERNLDAS